MESGIYQSFEGSDLFDNLLTPAANTVDTIFDEKTGHEDGTPQKVLYNSYSNNPGDEGPEVMSDSAKQYYIKETHFQDGSGNTYIKQEYIPQPEMQKSRQMLIDLLVVDI